MIFCNTGSINNLRPGNKGSCYLAVRTDVPKKLVEIQPGTTWLLTNQPEYAYPESGDPGNELLDT